MREIIPKKRDLTVLLNEFDSQLLKDKRVYSRRISKIAFSLLYILPYKEFITKDDIIYYYNKQNRSKNKVSGINGVIIGKSLKKYIKWFGKKYVNDTMACRKVTYYYALR